MIDCSAYSSEILDCVDWVRGKAAPGAKIRIDSRSIEQGDVFAALHGATVDGLAYAAVAASRHASAMLVEKREDILGKSAGLPVYMLENLRERLGLVASLFYGDPSAHMRGAAITGTNGKTSISHWVSAALTRLHHPCAAIGTIGAFLNAEKLPAPPLTTPDAASLQELFSEAYEKGAQAFAIEASSIGLEQGRLAGTSIETAAFTNLTRDHLDYHGTLEAYEKAKAILFDWPGLKNAVVNIDDEAGLRLARRALARGVHVITYSLQKKRLEGCSALNALDIENKPSSVAFKALWQGQSFPVEAQVIGRFNVSNILAAAGIMLTFGIDAQAVFSQMNQVRAPAGRLEPVVAENAPLIVVDYAHTPDALSKVIGALREAMKARAGARLWTVFGAGGDRDHGKRPLMGKAADEGSDFVVITTDNPRSEEPAAIAEAIAQACEKNKTRIVLDRRQAIVEAVCEAGAADVVLIAGKGHEAYQEVKGVRTHFSDLEAAREALVERRARMLKKQEAGKNYV